MKIDDPLSSVLRKSRHTVVFTGAGVSAESGIPTFRDALTGLWTQYEATQLASPQGFENNPARVWGWYEWRRMKVLRAQPNPAHVAIADMASLTPRLTLITQNVDDLHERAGSSGVIQLHGSIHQPRCFACSRPYAFPPGIPDEPEGGHHLEPPRCDHCQGRIRPGVVWFGEQLPEHAWNSARQAVQDCDVLISVGTSSAGLAGGGTARSSGETRRDGHSSQSGGNPAGRSRGLQSARQSREGVAGLVGGNAQSLVICRGSYDSGLGTFPFIVVFRVRETAINCGSGFQPRLDVINCGSGFQPRLDVRPGQSHEGLPT